MPSGIVHAQASAFLSLPCAALAYGAAANLPPREAAIHAGAAALGCLAGIPLSPDLDQEGLSSAESWIIKATFGLGFLWAMLWYPYARLVPHRSWVSHAPLVGTTGRLAYMGLFVAVAMAAGWKPPLVPLAWVGWAVCGLAISDSAHWFMDTKLPRRSRRRR